MKFAARIAGLALAAGLLVTLGAQANEQTIRKALTENFPNAQITSIKKTPYSGMFEVYLDGQIVYTDARGRYVFAGDVIELKSRRNLTQERLAKLQAVDWKIFPLEHAIKTVRGKGERKLVQFSDPDCPFCRKFEAELAKVDNLTVYTFLYPIESLHPKAVQTSRQIWCASNRSKAWDDYIKNGTVPGNDGKCANPIDSTVALATRLGISGTPTFFLANGVRVPGMVPAAQLERLLAANAR